MTENSTNVRSLVGRVPPQVRLLRASLGALQVLAPPLAAAWGEVLFRTPRRFPVPAREREWLAAATPFTVEAGSDRLPAWSWGAGPAVVLVHGWEGRGSQLGALALGLAQAGFRAVAFDAPGHGGARSRLSSLPQIAAGIAAVAAAVGPVRAVVGHSFGGAAACWALARGLAVERLALLAPPFDLDPYIVQFGALLGASPATVNGLVGRIERRFTIDWQEVRRPALAGAARAPQTAVLVVHDRDDEETAWAEGAQVAATWPRGEIVTTEGLGHRRLLRAPEVVARVAAHAALQH
jgi:pimeloyl-ACP methyl ester carboxylesterase